MERKSKQAKVDEERGQAKASGALAEERDSQLRGCLRTRGHLCPAFFPPSLLVQGFWLLLLSCELPEFSVSVNSL